MKKTYMIPSTISVKLTSAKFIAGSLNDGNGMSMSIHNSEAEQEAGSRRGGGVWDDEE